MNNAPSGPRSKDSSALAAGQLKYHTLPMQKRACGNCQGYPWGLLRKHSGAPWESTSQTFQVGETTGPGKSMAGCMCVVPRPGELLLSISVIAGSPLEQAVLCSGTFSPWKGTGSKEQHSHLHLEEPGIPHTWANCGLRPFPWCPAMGALVWLHHFVRVLR